MSGMSSLSSAASLVMSVQQKRVPLKMINAQEQVIEVITKVAEQIGFSDVKAKQREAGKDTFVSLLTAGPYGGGVR